MRKCECGEPLEDDWDVCPACGKQFEKKVICKGCGRELKPNWKLCPKCKTPVEGADNKNLKTPPNLDTPTPSGNSEGIVYSRGPLEGMGNQGMSSEQSYSRDNLVPDIELPANSVLDERYTIKQKLGQGGYGSVFLCDDDLMGEESVIKIMPDLNPNFLRSVVKEFKVRTKIRNQENIIMAYQPDKINYNGQDFIIYPMEYAEGGSLREKLPQIWNIKNIAEQEALTQDYFVQMCKGVSSIHKAGIVHLDIKPENFLFKDKQLKLADFGISRNLQKHDIDVSEIQEGIGSGPYMAPEQHETANPLDVDKRADIYALGVILYEMFSGGKRPYEGKNLGRKKRQYYPPKKLKNISPAYWQIIERCLAPDFEERFQEVEGLEDTFRKCSGKLEELLKEGEELFKAEEYDNALKVFREILAYDEENTKADEYIAQIEEIKQAESEKKAKVKKLLKAGRRFYKQKKYKNAKKKYEAVLELDPDNEEAEAKAKEINKIIKKQKKIKRLQRDGKKLFSQKKYKKAKDKFEELLNLDSANSEAKKKIKEIEKILKKQRQLKELIETRHLVLVEGGKFDMGSEDEDAADDEKPVHRVRVDSFYMSKYQVTQKLWKRVMGNNPSKFKGENRPVEKVNWFDAIKFCNAKSEKDGLECCYHLDGDTDLVDYNEDELEQVECNFSANGYRLPTEAEWEYAARGGVESDNANYRYAGSNNIDEVAWYEENSGDKTHPVGKKKPNELGIYDMSGNVWEWCWDWYDRNYYSSSPKTNPKGPNGSNPRVLRGGSCSYDDYVCRVAFRSYSYPEYGDGGRGFRFVRSVE